MTLRLNVLFLVALVGVLSAAGVLVRAYGGDVGLGGFLGAVCGLAVLVVLRARGLRREPADGRTCTCCTTSQHDPVKVV